MWRFSPFYAAERGESEEQSVFLKIKKQAAKPGSLTVMALPL